MSRRFWILFLGTAALFAAGTAFIDDEPALPRAARPPVADEHRGNTPSAKPEASRAPADSGAQPRDAFSPRSWYVAPPARPAPPPKPVVAQAAPPPPPPPPPPAPTAPPLPYQFVGKIHEAGKLKVFLQRGTKVHTVGVGDVVDGTYRVESITDTQMSVIYLPLNIRQTLAVGSKL